MPIKNSVFAKPKKYDLRISIEAKRKYFSVLRIYEAIASAIAFLLYPLRYIRYFEENFYPLFKLINSAFIKSPVHTFLAIFYPFIFIVILGNVLPAQSIIYSIGIMIPTVIGMLVLPTMLVTFKDSSLLKKIGATKIETWMVTLSFIVYFIIVSLVSAFFNLGIGILMFMNKLHLDAFSIPEIQWSASHDVVNWWQYLFAFIMGGCVAISVGMMIAALVKTPAQATLFGLLMTLPGGFLSGQFLTFDLLSSVPILDKIGYIFPQKWPTLLAIISTSGGNIFDFNNGWHVISFQNIGNITNTLNSIKKLVDPSILPSLITKLKLEFPIEVEIGSRSIFICSFIIPWIATLVAFLVTIRWFKWHSR